MTQPANGQILKSYQVQEALPLLIRDPIQNVFMIDSIQRRNEQDPVPSDSFFGIIHGDRLTAIEQVGSSIIFYSPEKEDIPLLAQFASEKSDSVYSLFGKKESIREFLQYYRCPAKKIRLFRETQRVYVLTREMFRPQPPVGLRLATEQDLETVFYHAAAMHLEELLEDPLKINPQWYQQRIKGLIQKNRYFIWQENAYHYFQARVSHLTDQVAQIEGVFTPKPFRNQGYATRGLSDLCRIWLEKVPNISLFVNDENTSAKRLYQKLGFQHIMDFQSVFYENK